MDGLRWLLLLFGLAAIAGVYIYSRRERLKPDTKHSAGRLAPSLDSDTAESGQADSESSDSAKAKTDRTAQKIVTLRLVARDKGFFRGDELILSLRGIGMRHGKFGIFHRFEGGDEDNPIFSAASLIEPGSFDLANIKEQQLPGISLFLVLPGHIDGAAGFDLMMATARALGQALNAELLDESGSTLSVQRERYMREEIIKFERSIKVA
jgi:cell division protein ZipA